MPEPEVKDKKVVEPKPGEVSETDTFNIKRDRVKTIKQVARESQDRIKKQRAKDLEEKAKETPEVVTPVVKKEEAPVKAEEKSEIKPETKEEEKVDTEALVKKAADEAAAKATAETKKEFQAKIDEILNKEKTDTEKQKEADELIAVWEKENRLPKDYPELIAETMRIADAKMAQRQKEIETKAAEERTAQENLKKAEEGAKKATENKQLEDFNKAIATDLDEIYTAKFLPRPANIEEINNINTTDPAAKETQKVLQFGIDLNTKLVAEGKPPVTSLNKIYFLHYKPFQDANPEKKSEQPAGADAPVAGSQHTIVETPGSKLGVPIEQLRKETWGQTLSRLRREAARKIAGK